MSREGEQPRPGPAGTACGDQPREDGGRRLSGGSVADVVARMEAILEQLSRSDGVVSFTRLYLEVTKAVQVELRDEAFTDPAFLTRLDVAFAVRFFEAFDGYGRVPPAAPPAWMPLFEDRSARGIAPIQFAPDDGQGDTIGRDLPRDPGYAEVGDHRRIDAAGGIAERRQASPS